MCDSGVFYAKSGILYLTNMRIIYITTPSLNHFKSFEIPLQNLRNGNLIQPWLGANYYSATLIPVENAGLRENGNLKLHFKDGGAFEFSSIYNQCLSRIAGIGKEYF